MSIVGTQSVSMSDLMKLGSQALSAIAQWQMPSIAPSYMVIAALKALTDRQRGTGAQVPRGTVKDQVLAQAAPPVQAGIGAMQPRPMGMQPPQMQPPMRQGMPMQPPVKGFSGADGESQVRGTAAVNAQIADYFRQRFGPGWDRFTEETRRGLAGRRRTEDEVNYGNEGNNYLGMPGLPKGTEPTKYEPTERVGTEKGRASNPATVELKPGAPVIPPPQIVAPPSIRGIGSTGINPTAKYKTINDLGQYAQPGPEATADQYKLDIPRNKQLEEAATKYATPDTARMQELRDAEKRAGLAAFARSMGSTKNGIGFGAAFGPAAADYIDAKEAKAEKRREYEDRREALATQLGIQVGAEAKADYLANSKWGAERADAANAQAIRVLQAKNEATRFGNAELLDREKMAQQERLESQKIALMGEANKIAAEVRRDGVDERKFSRLLLLQQGAAKVAQDAADAWVKANPAAMAGGPDVERRIADIKRREYQKLFPPTLEALMHQGLGIGTAQPQQAAPGKVVRGRL